MKARIIIEWNWMHLATVYLFLMNKIIVFFFIGKIL